LISEQLQEAGIVTAAFHSNPYISAFLGWNRGWDVFYDSMEDEVEPRIPYIRGNAVNQKAIDWISSYCKGGSRQPFFLWLHYMDVHRPYMPEETYLKQFCDQPVSRHKMYSLWRKMIQKPDEISPAEREIIINLYDADIKYTATVIGSLLYRLGNRLAGTIVVITADHGDELGEHGNFGHHSMYDGILRVPLIIAGPKIKSGISVTQQVSLIDLTPTIVD